MGGGGGGGEEGRRGDGWSLSCGCSLEFRGGTDNMVC